MSELVIVRTILCCIVYDSKMHTRGNVSLVTGMGLGFFCVCFLYVGEFVWHFISFIILFSWLLLVWLSVAAQMIA